VIRFTVIGRPAPQGSKKFMGAGVMVESSIWVAPWRVDVKHVALRIVPAGWDLSHPMELRVGFRFKRPAGHYGKRGLKPSAPLHLTSRLNGDLSKLVRSTEDSLTGVLYNDDSQIVSMVATKRYCLEGEAQGAVIELVDVCGPA